MGSWSTLPLELLTEILTLVYKQHYQSLSQCQFTCRNWNKPAQALLYSSVLLNTPQQAATFLNSVSLTNTNSIVKKVKFGRPLLVAPVFERLFPKLFEFCRNITHLEAEETDTAFWTKLLREFYKGNIMHLQSLPEAKFDDDGGIKIYGYVASALHATLTCVYVHDWPEHNPSFRNNEVAQTLTKFTNLESLFVRVGGIDTILKILPSLCGCSKLRKVHIRTIEARKIAYSEGDIDNGDASDEDDTVEECPFTKSYSNVTNLKIDSITLTGKLIRKLMQTFPKLESLELNNVPERDEEDDPDEEEDRYLLYRYQSEGWKITDELWMEFLLYVHNTIPKYHLSKLFFENIPSIIEKFTEATGVPNDFLELLYVHRNTHCDIKSYVQISSNAGDRNSNSGAFSDRKESIQVIYGNNISDNTNTLEHISLLDRLGGRLKSLCIRIPPGETFFADDDNVNQLVDGEFLGHIFQSCPQLMHLMVERACIYHCNTDSSINTSIETVRFTQCNINPGVFSDLSGRLPQLAYLHIGQSDFFPSSGHIVDSPKNVDLQMQYSKLKLLVWENYSRRYEGATALHLKISKGSKPQYRILKKSSQKISRSTANSFGASLQNHANLSIDILCTKIEHLVVCTRDFNIHINVSDMTVSKGTSYLKSIQIN